jgi:hypothetical protein
MWWRNAERRRSHPLDPTVNVLEVFDSDGRPKAVLVNYACHPSVLGPDNLDYLADYPGALRRYVEAQIPGALYLFVQGGAGDIDPCRDKEPVAGEDFQAVEERSRRWEKVTSRSDVVKLRPVLQERYGIDGPRAARRSGDLGRIPDAVARQEPGAGFVPARIHERVLCLLPNDRRGCARRLGSELDSRTNRGRDGRANAQRLGSFRFTSCLGKLADRPAVPRSVTAG